METLLKWKNVHRDDPPQDGQLVILSVNGICYLTEYDSGHGVYRLRDDRQQIFSPADSVIMYWLETD
jgi:hypothetical protein